MDIDKDVNELITAVVVLAFAAVVFAIVYYWKPFLQGAQNASASLASGIDVGLYPLKTSTNPVASNIGNSTANAIDPITAWLVGAFQNLSQGKAPNPVLSNGTVSLISGSYQPLGG